MLIMSFYLITITVMYVNYVVYPKILCFKLLKSIKKFNKFEKKFFNFIYTINKYQFNL